MSTDVPDENEESIWQRGYGWFLGGMGGATLAVQVQNAVIGYQMYELTGDALALGLVGLAEALPFIALVMVGGHVADRRDRRVVSLVTLAAMVAMGLGLFLVSTARAGGLAEARLGAQATKWAIYGLIVFGGVCRAFLQPARVALSAQLLPRRDYARGVALRTATFQICAVTGPAVGGLVYGFVGPGGAYLVGAGLLAAALVCTWRVPRAAPAPAPTIPQREAAAQTTAESERAGAATGDPALVATPAARRGLSASARDLFLSLTEGVRYLARDRLLRSAILLDLFAVLFGGAVALLPVFATEILAVGPRGFGLLRAAPAAGALLVAGLMALLPPMRRAGLVLLLAVAGFGMAMIGFALSRIFVLSLALLAVSGGLDMLSVLVRSTLLQLRVPLGMMGRVAAINQIFIGSSNEIGAFESGLAARLLGTVRSVVVGGALTLGVVAVAAWRAPELRKLDRLDS